MGSKTATSNRNAERQANTAELMSNIMAPGAGEISKAREKQLQDAANFGRGVQFIPGSPTVKGVMQIDPATGEKKPVYRTGTTAADFTGKIIANQPTVGELFGDIGRGLMGGQADTPQFNLPTSRPGTPTQDFANMLPTPQRSEGIIPALLNTGGIGGLALNIVQDLFGKGKNFLFPEEEEEDTFSSAADAMGGAAAINLGDIRTQRNLAGTTGDEIDQLTQREVGPTVDLRTPTIEELVTTPVSQTGETTSPTIADYLSSGFGGARPSENALFNPQEGFMYPKDYTLPFTNIEVPSLGRAIESAVTGGQGFDAEMNLTPEGDILYNKLIEEFDFTPEDAIERIKVMDRSGLRNSGIPLYADGGLTKTVAPQEGPMSTGVASLLKKK